MSQGTTRRAPIFTLRQQQAERGRAHATRTYIPCPRAHALAGDTSQRTNARGTTDRRPRTSHQEYGQPNAPKPMFRYNTILRTVIVF